MKLLFVCLSVFSASFCLGQMSTTFKAPPSTTLGKVNNLGTFIGEITYSVNPANADTIYTLAYNNYEYTHIKDVQTITFSGAGHTIDSLYKVMKSVFDKENRKKKDYIVLFKLGNEDVSVAAFRVFGSTTCRIAKTTSYGLFTERQLDKLFGKVTSTPQNERLD